MLEYKTDINEIIGPKLKYIEELNQKKIKLEARKARATDSDIIESIDLSLAKLNYVINGELNIISFCRVPNQEDISYRVNFITSEEFLRELYNSFPKDLPLRFHGSPIYYAKQIIESGIISSSVDRVGFETSSNNVSNQISTYDKSFFQSCITGYMNLVDIYLPLGCLFVLIDSDSTLDNFSGLCSMKNCDISNNSENLFGIITSPENVEMVREWCNQSNVDSNKVFEFKEFLAYLKHKRL